MSLSELWSSPLFGVAVTVMVYALALELRKKWRWLHPLFITSVVLIGLLLAVGIPYEAYRVGGDIIVFFLGPATVALGVPLYKHSKLIRKDLIAILLGITAGCVSGLIGGALFLWLFGAPQELILSMMPKSVTSPIALEIARQLGGIPELGAVFAVLTGLLGSMIGPFFLRSSGMRNDISIGIAIGTSSHGIGTSRVMADSELQGGISSFAMAVSGIVTSLLVIPLYGWLHS